MSLGVRGEEGKGTELNDLSDREATHELVHFDFLEAGLGHMNPHCVGNGVIQQAHAEFKDTVTVHNYVLGGTAGVEGKRYLHLHV